MTVGDHLTPFDLAWPRASESTVLRLLTMDDLEAMYSYRCLPEVCRFLNHDPLTRDAVAQRIRARLKENQSDSGPTTCGVAIVVNGRMVGDAMLRVEPDGNRLWIGYGFHPSVWGRGLATEVAKELVGTGRHLGLTVWADSYADNIASQRVLERAGLAFRHAEVTGTRLLHVFSKPP